MGEILESIGEIHSIGAATRELMVSPAQCPALRQHRIMLTGQSEARRGFSFVRLRPGKSQILACTGGRGDVWIPDGSEAGRGGTWRSCTAGQAYVTSAMAPHGYRARARESWSVCWVTYDLPHLADARTEPQLLQCDTRALHHSLAGLCHEAAGTADSAILEDWARLVHANAMRLVQRPPDSRRLRTLWEAAGASLSRPWTLENLAREAGMGEEQLRRVSLKETGRSPMQHLTSLRITRATALLLSGRSVKEVAPAVGYQNAFSFSSTYKRWTGRSPSSVVKA